MVIEDYPPIVRLDGLVAGSMWLEGEDTDSLGPYCTFLVKRTGSFELVWPPHCDQSQL